ncbi:hypothetical protein HD554DRAFT_2171734 [Boletus coccyginus]|nr:hypothetical protein HD554DRAFT_2171734 [Boletus coccyginus]
MSRQGGKLKPLKAAKKEKKDEDEDDKAFKERKKAEEAALKAAKDKGMHDLASDKEPSSPPSLPGSVMET